MLTSLMRVPAQKVDEAPENAEVVIRSAQETVDESAGKILAAIRKAGYANV